MCQVPGSPGNQAQVVGLPGNTETCGDKAFQLKNVLRACCMGEAEVVIYNPSYTQISQIKFPITFQDFLILTQES